MKSDFFETLRDFNNKFPSKLYICCNCGQLLANPIICLKCGFRADGLFKTMDKGYKFRIGDGEEIEIFKPLELLRV